jgi:hypothetical protein
MPKPARNNDSRYCVIALLFAAASVFGITSLLVLCSLGAVASLAIGCAVTGLPCDQQNMVAIGRFIGALGAILLVCCLAAEGLACLLEKTSPKEPRDA